MSEWQGAYLVHTKPPGYALVTGTQQINSISKCRIVPNMVIATLSDDNTHPSEMH